MKRAPAPKPPVMDLVAGPQGSGKSTFFPVAGRGRDAFNIDERRKELNGGSAQRIPMVAQRKATADYEAFIASHINRGRSFSIEVTLGKEVTFQQAERARLAGFSVQLTYVAAEVEDCVSRVANRVEMGGHGTKVGLLRKTHAASLRNLARAIRDFDVVQVYDNSRQAGPEDSDEACMPRLVLESQRGAVTFRAADLPRWLRRALAGSGWLAD